MSQKPACIQCGGTDYVLESGFYFCSECQVQSQDIREEVYDDYWQGQRTGRISIPAPSSQEVGTQDSILKPSVATDKSLTSWEVFNVILKGLVDELTLLGAPKELKLIVLQLWATYLMKSEAAFISKHIEKRPRLDLNFRKRDAELIYGTDKELISVYKKPIYRKKIEKSCRSSEKGLSSHTNTRMEQYKLTKKRNLLVKAEYERSSVSSQPSEITLESLSVKSVSSSSQKSYKLRYNKKAKVALSSMLDAASEIDIDARSSLQKKIFGREAQSIQHVSMSKVLAILRLALLILDSDIHLGDIL
ncbi:TATA box-binding protein-associated factor RNA polymerase I subunit B, partial [Halyomorpha halys]